MAGASRRLERERRSVLLDDAVSVLVFETRLSEQTPGLVRVVVVESDLRVVRPRHRLDDGVDDRDHSAENFARDPIAIDRVRYGPSNPNVSKRGDFSQVQSNVGVRVRHRTSQRDALDALELVQLVERDVVDDVDFARAELVYPCVAAG